MKNSTSNLGMLSQYSKKIFVRLVFVSGIVSLALVVFLGAKADWSELFSTLRWGWLVCAVGALAVLQFVSGYRLYCLLPKAAATRSGQYLNAVKVMYSLQALIKLLPFRLGEAAFFWLAHRNLGLSFQENLGVFLSFRIWDFRVVALSFLLFGGLLFQDKVPWGHSVFLVAGVGGVLLFSLSSYRLVRLGEEVFRCCHRLTSFNWADRCAQSLNEAAASLEKMGSLRGSAVIGMQSGAVWIVYFFVFCSLYNCVGVPIGWAEAVVVVSGMILVGILPIQTIGGIGLVELGQASLLVLADIPPSMAASKSLAVGALFLGLCIAVPLLLTGIFTLCGKRAVAVQ